MSRYSTTLFEIFDLQKYAIKLGLENITYLSKIVNNPHLKYPTIHIAGTNGKGSTAIILQQILMEHGFKVGLYTSPHLVSFNERIRINNNLIENQFIIDFWDTIKKFVLEKKATFFDTTTCLAFEYFYQRKVDVAIFETGLGGRLDSTNIIQPEATLLTPISFDHQKQLGNTLTDIAMEKAGIIKQNSHLFLGHQNEEVHSYFKSKFEFIHEVTDQCDVIKNVKIQPGLNFTHF
jgi:dihydrofolate synthase/folylpolyglutamate synthase